MEPGAWGEGIPEPDWDLYPPGELAAFWAEAVPDGETVTAGRAGELWAEEKARAVARLERIRAVLLEERRRRSVRDGGHLGAFEAGLAAELARLAAGAGLTVLDPVMAAEIFDSAWDHMKAVGEWPDWYDPEPDEAMLGPEDAWPDAATWAASPPSAGRPAGAVAAAPARAGFPVANPLSQARPPAPARPERAAGGRARVPRLLSFPRGRRNRRA